MTYEVWQGFAQNESGDVLDTASVTVTLAGTTTKPALFSDEDGAGSKTNPFNTDASGFVQFYTAPAIVDIVATKGAFSVTFSNVRIGLPDALQTVATLAELQAIDASGFVGGETYKLKSRLNGWAAYANDTLSGGTFVWAVSNFTTQAPLDTPQGWFVKSYAVAVTVGMFVRVGEDSVYPEHFGALANGITDDYAAVQAADNVASNLGLTVRFREKVYYIESSGISKSRQTTWIGVPGKSGGEAYFEIRASGTTITSGLTSGTAFITIPTNSGNVSYHENAGMQGISIQGDLTKSTSLWGIDVGVNVRGQLFRDVQVRHFSRGINATTTGQLYLENCFISHCKYSLYMTEVSDSWFRKCHFGSSVTNVPSLSSATLFAGGSGVYHHAGQNLKFSACRFQVQYQGAGATFIGSRGVKFDGACQYDLNGRQALFLQGVNDFEIMGGFFKNNYENYIVSPSPGTKYSHIEIRSTGETFTAAAGTDLITVSGTYRYRGTQCQFSTSGTLPAGLSADTIYYLGYNTLTTKYVYLNEHDMQNGTNRIDITDAGTGTHYLHQYTSNIDIRAGFNGVIGETEDCGACVNLAAKNTSGAGGIISGVTMTGGSYAADSAVKYEITGTDSVIKNIVFNGNSIDPRTDVCENPSQVTSEVSIGNNVGYDQTHEIADASYGWRTAEGVKVIKVNTAITALRFVTLFNDGARSGDVVKIPRRATGASAVRVRDDSLATLEDIAVDEMGEFLFDGTSWVSLGVRAI